jgi:hypothetical protein
MRRDKHNRQEQLIEDRMTLTGFEKTTSALSPIEPGVRNVIRLQIQASSTLKKVRDELSTFAESVNGQL